MHPRARAHPARLLGTTVLLVGACSSDTPAAEPSTPPNAPRGANAAADDDAHLIAFVEQPSFEDIGRRVLVLDDGTAFVFAGADAREPARRARLGEDGFRSLAAYAEQRGARGWPARTGGHGVDGTRWTHYFASDIHCYTSTAYPAPSDAAGALDGRLAAAIEAAPSEPLALDTMAGVLAERLRSTSGETRTCLARFVSSALSEHFPTERPSEVGRALLERAARLGGTPLPTKR